MPNNALVAVSGATSRIVEMQSLLNAAWHGWKPHKLPARSTHAFPPPTARRILFTEAPKTSQSEVLIGWRGPRLGDPDALPLMVANKILGGEFSSRLMQNIRETKGFSYGVWSSLWFYDNCSLLTAGGSIQAAHTAEAITEFEKEFERLLTGDLSAEEIARAKESLIRSIPPLFETNGAVAGAIAGRVELGVPVDYYTTYPGRIAKVTTDEMVRAVRRYVTPGVWPIVVVGPKEQVLESLGKLGLGPVEELPAKGAER